MPIVPDRLSFMHETRTDVWIAEQSGIPRSTLGFVRRGERPMPLRYLSAARKLYQSEMVGRLEAIGIPQKQAFAHSFISPARFRAIDTQMYEIVGKLTTGHLAERAARHAERGEYYDPGREYSSLFDSVMEGIHESEQPLDEILAGRVS